MYAKKIRIAVRSIAAVAALACFSKAGATTITATEQPGIVANLISVTGLSSSDTIGSTVGGIVSGGGGPLAGNIKRFALPGQDYTGAAGAPGGNLWNAWAAYSRSNIGFEYTPLRSDGHVNVYLAGIDYTFNSRTIFGVAIAADRTDVDLNFSGGRLKGRGVTVSPYIGHAFSNNVALDATLGFGRTDIDTSTAGVTGSTESDRVIGAMGVTLRHAIGNWQLTGRGSFLAVRDKLGAYTLSNGTFVPDGTVNISQLRATGQVAYGTGNVVPYFGLSYIHDLNRPDQAPIGGLAAANDEDAWTPVIGLRFKTGGSLYGSVQYSTERGRSEVKNDQFLVNIGIRF